MNYHTEEGPIIQEWVKPKRKICSQCKWCKEERLYTHRSSDIQFAYCLHPEGGSDLYKRLDSWRHGDYLDHDKNTVFTPEWCPVKTTNP